VAAEAEERAMMDAPMAARKERSADIDFMD
jgi:hypothetical protein